jgi:uncharacterized membrane protein/protein-disulfide isomerase
MQTCIENGSEVTGECSHGKIPKDGPCFSGTAPFIVTLGLGLIGVFATGFLTYRHILLTSHGGTVGESFLCRPTGNINCDAILMTPYAVIFNYFPSSVLGLMGFTFMLWLSVNGLVNPRIRNDAWAWLLFYVFVAIAFSWYYAYIMVFEVDFICTWCIVVHLVNLISVVFVFIVAVKNRKKFEHSTVSNLAERVYLVVGGVVTSLLVFFACGFWEKSLSFHDAKQKYDELAKNPLVIMSLLKASPHHQISSEETDPVYGSVSAPHPMILFSDFQCPVCLRTEIFLREIVDRNPNELRLVFKNYPLSTACNKRIANDLHPMACKAAQAAYAAFLIGGSRSFLTYADLLYVHQRQLKSEPWIGLAKQTGLELQRFTLLMEPDSAADRKVREDVALGLELGLDATPEVFFEGKRIPQGLKGEDFVAALEELIRISHPEKKDLNLNR